MTDTTKKILLYSSIAVVVGLIVLVVKRTSNATALKKEIESKSDNDFEELWKKIEASPI
jgi:hypothetical protein